MSQNSRKMCMSFLNVPLVKSLKIPHLAIKTESILEYTLMKQVRYTIDVLVSTLLNNTKKIIFNLNTKMLSIFNPRIKITN